MHCIIVCLLSYFRHGVPSHSFSLQARVEVVNGEVTIHKVQQTDSGMYQCVAENKYGAVYSNAELKILGSCMFGFYFQSTHNAATFPVRRKYSCAHTSSLVGHQGEGN